MFTRCTSSFDLHMLIVPFPYLFGTLLVPKVATGAHLLIVRVVLICLLVDCVSELPYVLCNELYEHAEYIS